LEKRSKPAYFLIIELTNIKSHILTIWNLFLRRRQSEAAEQIAEQIYMGGRTLDRCRSYSLCPPPNQGEATDLAHRRFDPPQRLRHASANSRRARFRRRAKQGFTIVPAAGDDRHRDVEPPASSFPFRSPPRRRLVPSNAPAASPGHAGGVGMVAGHDPGDDRQNRNDHPPNPDAGTSAS
jgi:hypothetical protein